MRTHKRTHWHARTHRHRFIITITSHSYPKMIFKVDGITCKNKHTHNFSSRNWVLILVGAKILWEEEGFQFGFERWKWSCGSEFQMWGPKQEKVRKPWALRLYCWISACGCQKKSIALVLDVLNFYGQAVTVPERSVRPTRIWEQKLGRLTLVMEKISSPVDNL